MTPKSLPLRQAARNQALTSLLARSPVPGTKSPPTAPASWTSAARGRHHPGDQHHPVRPRVTIYRLVDERKSRRVIQAADPAADPLDLAKAQGFRSDCSPDRSGAGVAQGALVINPATAQSARSSVRTADPTGLRDQLGHNDWSTLVPLYVTRLVDYNNEVCIIHSLICWTNHIIYCIKNKDLAYLDNLGIMCAEFDRQLTANLATYSCKALIGELLKQYKLKLELARTAMHPAEASHL